MRPLRVVGVVLLPCVAGLVACGGEGNSGSRSADAVTAGLDGERAGPRPAPALIALAANATRHPPLHAIADRPASDPLPERFGVGREATAGEVAAIDIDIMPDGEGLPPGRGSVQEGAVLYAAQCVACHGADLRGTPIGDPLVPDPARPGFPDGEAPGSRSIGSYWPYATTVFDYIRRSMPYDRPGSLSDDQVYALTAYLLWMNGIVEESAVMDAGTLAAVVMPARDRFVVDDRPGSDRVR
jgi:S-disulfanyl-L-cysteine oxidoreductase SoxD